MNYPQFFHFMPKGICREKYINEKIYKWKNQNGKIKMEKSNNIEKIRTKRHICECQRRTTYRVVYKIHDRRKTFYRSDGSHNVCNKCFEKNIVENLPISKQNRKQKYRKQHKNHNKKHHIAEENSVSTHQERPKLPYKISNTQIHFKPSISAIVQRYDIEINMQELDHMSVDAQYLDCSEYNSDTIQTKFDIYQFRQIISNLLEDIQKDQHKEWYLPFEKQDKQKIQSLHNLYEYLKDLLIRIESTIQTSFPINVAS